MISSIRRVVRCGSVLALAGMACASQQQPTNPTAQVVQSQQQQSQEALNRAHEAQKRASQQEKKATLAQENVQKAQQALIQAQQDARREQALAEQMQREATALTGQATQQAGQSQQQAQQSLAQQGRQVQQGQLWMAGEVLAASGSRLVLRPRSGEQPMTFRITDQTNVRVDGQQASLADIQQGVDARVSYQTTGSTQPEALAVDVMGAATPAQGVPPAPPAGTR